MKNRKLWIIPGAIVVALLLWIVVGRGEGAESEYRFVAVERDDVVQVVSATGALQATQTVEVGTQVSGQVAQIFVDFNDRVQRGQLIARIDPTLPLQEVRSAEANLQRVQAEVAQTQRDLERARQLHEQQVVTDAELEQAQYAYSVARASYNAAQVSVERARRNLGYTEIRSPVNGVVIDRAVDVGQTVAASMSAPTLFVIAQDLAEMEILAAVDESDIGRIHEGQDVRFTVQAYPDEEFAGVVSQVRLQSAMQENVVSYMVVVRVGNVDGRLIPGMTATVDFIIERAEGGLVVPNSALRFRPTAEMLAQIGGEPAAGAQGGQRPGAQRQRRRAGGGEQSGTLWYLDNGRLDTMVVRTGLSDGQRTVVSGDRLEEGLEIIAAVTSTDAAGSTNPFQTQQQNDRPGPRGAF
ncbi:MAG TPA: efflux RND transporter periplasmic adaptor subunit [Longimicrobiales bacterium]